MNHDKSNSLYVLAKIVKNYWVNIICLPDFLSICNIIPNLTSIQHRKKNYLGRIFLAFLSIDLLLRSHENINKIKRKIKLTLKFKLKVINYILWHYNLPLFHFPLKYSKIKKKKQNKKKFKLIIHLPKHIRFPILPIYYTQHSPHFCNIPKG